MRLPEHQHQCDINSAVYKLMDKLTVSSPMMLCYRAGDLDVKKVTDSNIKRYPDVIGVYTDSITFNEVVDDVNAFFSEF